MTVLASWFEAYAFARRRLRLSRERSIEYADDFFECPYCAEPECGGTCAAMMLEDLDEAAGVAA